MRMFCFHCRDGEDGGRLRAIHRPAHLDFVHANAEHFVIVGPLMRADGLIIGSLLIVKAADEAAAREILADDPYLTGCLLYTSPSPRDRQKSRMPSSA